MSMTADKRDGSAAFKVTNVLVVDDDADINRLVSLRLKARGFTVESARDGESALSHLDQSDRPAPDLMFLDVSMPGISGLEVLEQVRQRGSDLAVIMMTAFGTEQVAVEALRRGADEYLRKPFEPAEFRAVLDRTVKRLELTRQNTWLRAQLDEKRRQLEAELTRAAEVQAGLLPQEPPALPPFEVAARCVPARQVGGDFYDWQEAAPRCLSITLGDVMGKGMPAALLMATTRAVLQAAGHQNSPAAAVSIAEHALGPDLERSGSFVTLFHGHLNAETHVLTYVDAGHGYAFVRRANGSVEHLSEGGLPLGVLIEDSYTEGSVVLQSGDVAVVYSDGLAEAHPDRLLDVTAVAETLGGLTSAATIVDHLIALADCEGDCPDDLTVLAVCCHGE